MTRFAFALLLSAGSALAQQPGYPAPQPGQPPVVQPPNFGARQPQQPLSPYLNLLSGAGANPAVNYYNIARPFLQPPPSPFAAQPGMIPQPSAFPAQTGYLRAPALPSPYLRDPTELTDGSTLPPTGHPVVFGNRTPGGRGGFLPSGQQPAQTPATMPRAKR